MCIIHSTCVECIHQKDCIYRGNRSKSLKIIDMLKRIKKFKIKIVKKKKESAVAYLHILLLGSSILYKRDSMVHHKKPPLSLVTDLSQKCPAYPSWHLHRRMSPPLSQYTAKLAKHFRLTFPDMIANIQTWGNWVAYLLEATERGQAQGLQEWRPSSPRVSV